MCFLNLIALIDEIAVNLKTFWNHGTCMHTHKSDFLYTAAPLPV